MQSHRPPHQRLQVQWQLECVNRFRDTPKIILWNVKEVLDNAKIILWYVQSRVTMGEE